MTSINTEHTESRISWVGRVLLSFWHTKWMHFLCGISEGLTPGPLWTPSIRRNRLLQSAGPASLSWLRRMQPCPCKAAGKLSHINNNIQSGPCFFAGAGQHLGGWLMATSLLRILYLHFQEAPASISVAKKMQGEKARRGSRLSIVGMWSWDGSAHTKDFCPLEDKRHQCTSGRKATVASWFGWWEKLFS